MTAVNTICQAEKKSYSTTYDWMLTKYFTVRVEMQSEDCVIIRQKLLPIDQRPTQNQMETYIRKTLQQGTKHL